MIKHDAMKCVILLQIVASTITTTESKKHEKIKATTGTPGSLQNPFKSCQPHEFKGFEPNFRKTILWISRAIHVARSHGGFDMSEESLRLEFIQCVRYKFFNSSFFWSSATNCKRIRNLNGYIEHVQRELSRYRDKMWNSPSWLYYDIELNYWKDAYCWIAHAVINHNNTKNSQCDLSGKPDEDKQNQLHCFPWVTLNNPTITSTTEATSTPATTVVTTEATTQATTKATNKATTKAYSPKKAQENTWPGIQHNPFENCQPHGFKGFEPSFRRMLLWISKVIHVARSDGGFDMLEEPLRLQFVNCIRYKFFHSDDFWSSTTNCKQIRNLIANVDHVQRELFVYWSTEWNNPSWQYYNNEHNYWSDAYCWIAQAVINHDYTKSHQCDLNGNFGENEQYPLHCFDWGTLNNPAITTASTTLTPTKASTRVTTRVITETTTKTTTKATEDVIKTFTQVKSESDEPALHGKLGNTSDEDDGNDVPPVIKLEESDFTDAATTQTVLEVGNGSTARATSGASKVDTLQTTLDVTSKATTSAKTDSAFLTTTKAKSEADELGIDGIIGNLSDEDDGNDNPPVILLEESEGTDEATTQTLNVSNETTTQATIKVADEVTTQTTSENANDATTHSATKIANEATTQATSDASYEKTTQTATYTTSKTTSLEKFEIDEPVVGETFGNTSDEDNENDPPVILLEENEGDDEESTQATFSVANEATIQATTKVADEVTTQTTSQNAYEATTQALIKISKEKLTQATTKVADDTTTPTMSENTNEKTTRTTTDATLTSEAKSKPEEPVIDGIIGNLSDEDAGNDVPPVILLEESEDTVEAATQATSNVANEETTQATSKISNDRTTPDISEVTNDATTKATTKVANDETTQVKSEAINEANTQAKSEAYNEATSQAIIDAAAETTTQETSELYETANNGIIVNTSDEDELNNVPPVIILEESDVTGEVTTQAALKIANEMTTQALSEVPTTKVTTLAESEAHTQATTKMTTQAAVESTSEATTEAINTTISAEHSWPGSQHNPFENCQPKGFKGFEHGFRSMLHWISKVIHIKHSHGGFHMLEDQLRLEFIRCVRYILFDSSDTWSSITSCERIKNLNAIAKHVQRDLFVYRDKIWNSPGWLYYRKELNYWSDAYCWISHAVINYNSINNPQCDLNGKPHENEQYPLRCFPWTNLNDPATYATSQAAPEVTTEASTTEATEATTQATTEAITKASMNTSTIGHDWPGSEHNPFENCQPKGFKGFQPSFRRMLLWISKVIHIAHSHGGFYIVEDNLRLEFIKCVRYKLFDPGDLWSSILNCKRLKKLNANVEHVQRELFVYWNKEWTSPSWQYYNNEHFYLRDAYCWIAHAVINHKYFDKPQCDPSQPQTKESHFECGFSWAIINTSQN